MANYTRTNNITSDSKTGFDKVATYNGATKHLGDFPNPNDIPNRQTVEEIVSGSSSPEPLEISVPSGSNIPFNVLVADLIGYETGFAGYSGKIVITPTQNRYINDIVVDENWSDDGHTELASIDIYGHPNDTDGLTTQDDLIITFFK